MIEFVVTATEYQHADGKPVFGERVEDSVPFRHCLAADEAAAFERAEVGRDEGRIRLRFTVVARSCTPARWASRGFTVEVAP